MNVYVLLLRWVLSSVHTSSLRMKELHSGLCIVHHMETTIPDCKFMYVATTGCFQKQPYAY